MKNLTSAWGLLNFISLFFCQPAFADDFAVEYKIKAGYIFNFTKFIAWPADDSATFNLCIVKKDPFGTVIDSIETRSAQNRPIKVFRLDELDTGHSCHILFIGSADISVNNLHFMHGRYKTLTVGEFNEFAAHGGMIGFVNRDGKIKLQINLDALKKAGLKISAKLLEVAEIIKVGSHE